MVFKNAIRDGQPQPRAGADVFGTEKWIEYALFHTARNARSRIHYHHIHHVIENGRLNRDLLSRTFRHRVAGIGKEVNKDLFELNGTAAHERVGLC